MAYDALLQVVINVMPVNRHTPYFPPEVYVAVNVLENVGTDYDILELFAVDLDPGVLGEMTFTTDNELFRVDSDDGKMGILRPNG